MVSNINNLGNNTPIKQQAAQQAQVKQQNTQASTQTNQAQQVRQDSEKLAASIARFEFDLV